MKKNRNFYLTRLLVLTNVEFHSLVAGILLTFGGQQKHASRQYGGINRTNPSLCLLWLNQLSEQ